MDETIQRMVSDHIRIKLDISNKSEILKNTLIV